MTKSFFCVYVVIIIAFAQYVHCQRKIVDGKPLAGSKRYMAYLLKAPKDKAKYDAWLCGGAIVTPEFIVTSAACIKDVIYMYAIAGTDTYVRVQNMDQNECISKMKKKVIFTCVSQNYELIYEKIEKWANIDIGVVKVESPYDFDGAPPTGCSWAPNKIQINYSQKYQTPGTDTMIIGWGHDAKWREASDRTDHNQSKLRYNTLLIVDKTVCLKVYSGYSGMDTIIQKYMICCDGEGNINDEGILKEGAADDEVKLDGCPQGTLRVGENCISIREIQKKLLRSGPKKVKDEMTTKAIGNDESKIELNYDYNNGEVTDADFLQGHSDVTADMLKRIELHKIRQQQGSSQNVSKLKESRNQTQNGQLFLQDLLVMAKKNINKDVGKNINFRRGTGICQNDHGGPLITWIGAREVIIGIASVFRIGDNLDCSGPFMFTSTKCNSGFLECVLNPNSTDKTRRDFCSLSPKERGFEMISRRISWANHPDGPAANELAREDLFVRPQRPLHEFHGTKKTPKK